MKSLKLPERNSENSKLGRDVLEEGRNAFESLRDFYTRRERASRFAFDNQWLDKMEDPDTGDTITEDEYIRKQGRVPAQNNQIGKIVRSLTGQIRNNYPDPVAVARAREKAQAGEMMTAALQAVTDINQCADLDARNFEEFVVSAQTGWKITYDWWSDYDRNDVLIENINQSRFFFNLDSNDIRNKDVYLVGELHDMRWDEILKTFATSKSDYKRLQDMFPAVYDYEGQIHKYPEYKTKFRDYYIPESADKHRVIEIWKKEYEWQYFIHDFKDGTYTLADEEFYLKYFTEEMNEAFDHAEKVQLINQQRLEYAQEQGVDPSAVKFIELDERYEEIWRVYFLSPLGDILMMIDSPYEHQSHPYVFGRYPMFDGKTLSLVESVIDQQKHINRLISMMDAAFGKSVKNIMMVPKQLVPEGMNEYEFANQMVEYNGIIYYRHDPSIPMPKVISNNAQVAGANELLNLQLELMKEITSVNDAIQGNAPSAGTPAALYAQQTANAQTANRDIFDTYFNLMKRRNRKVVQLIREFYDEPRYINIAGSGFKQSITSTYEPEEVKDLDFDIVIGEAQQTLAYRQMVDTQLKEFLAGGYIDIYDYLKTTSMPFADKLLSLIENKNERMGEGEQGGQPSEEELMQIIQEHNSAMAA